jgi:hypothetical protein
MSFPFANVPFTRSHLLSVHMNIHRATLMPRRKQDTATATVVLDIFEGIHHVRNEAEA